MELEDRTRSTPDHRIALLIDADNVPHSKIAEMLAELSKYGTANIRRAYGDWASAGLKNWKDKLHDFAIRPIQQFSYSTGKNATDIALLIDAMELLYQAAEKGHCPAMKAFSSPLSKAIVPEPSASTGRPGRTGRDARAAMPRL